MNKAESTLSLGDHAGWRPTNVGNSHTLSFEEARRLAVRRQLLDGRSELAFGKEGTAQAIERLGYVQIDTISVVARAHHQTLRARTHDYDPTFLHELLACDRRIFEYWGHAASILPISDFRYYLPAMRRAPSSERGKDWAAKNADVMEHVLHRIEQEGPLASKDFQAPEGHRGGEWWNWKPSKMALEMLFAQGRLMVTQRRNFQRVYDLTARVLPRDVEVTVPDDEEAYRFFVRRALASYGVATEREIREHIGPMNLRANREAIAALIEEGEIVRASVQGRDSPDLYALPGVLESVPAVDAEAEEAHCRLLCPFDNLIILRERAKWLFDFEYTLECYVPEGKRVWGYFVFPVLFGDRIVGRLDPKADRKSKTLIVRSLHFESSVQSVSDLLEPLAAELARFARFNGCRGVQLEKIVPTGHKRALKGLTKRALNGEP